MLVAVLKYSPNARFLAAGNNENTIFVFDASRDYRTHCRCAGHTTYITALDWSAGSDVLRTNCAANEVLFWDVLNRGSQVRERSAAHLGWATESLVMSFTTMGIFEDGDSPDQYNGVDTSSDRSVIVVCDDDGCVKLYNYPCVVKNAPYKERGAHCSHVSGVCFTADDSYAVSVGAKDRGVFCWKLLRKGEGNEDGTCASTFGWEESDYSDFVDDAVAEAGRDAGPDVDAEALVVCEYCNRSFRPEALLKHQELCANVRLGPFPAVVGKEVRLSCHFLHFCINQQVSRPFPCSEKRTTDRTNDATARSSERSTGRASRRGVGAALSRRSCSRRRRWSSPRCRTRAVSPRSSAAGTLPTPTCPTSTPGASSRPRSRPRP